MYHTNEFINKIYISNNHITLNSSGTKSFGVANPTTTSTATMIKIAANTEKSLTKDRTCNVYVNIVHFTIHKIKSIAPQKNISLLCGKKLNTIKYTCQQFMSHTSKYYTIPCSLLFAIQLHKYQIVKMSNFYNYVTISFYVHIFIIMTAIILMYSENDCYNKLRNNKLRSGMMNILQLWGRSACSGTSSMPWREQTFQ